MKHLAILCAAASIFSQAPSASPKSDSIVAFTGARTKIVWLRFAYRNTDYSAMSRAAATTAGESVMLFDTDEGQERVLGTGLTVQSSYAVTAANVQDNVRISRSGHWATVADSACTYIFNLTGTNPNKRVFLGQSSCTYWCVKAWGRDSATGNEYAYTLDNFNMSTGTYLGSAIYKIPVNADGSANMAGAVKIPISGSPQIDGALSVSADLKKIGGEFPWPSNPGILDVATGSIAGRINGPACHTNLAADASYRFFHLNGDHNGIYMWDKGMGTTNWYVPLETTMVNHLTGEFWCPRWSNNPLFIASTFPAAGGSDVIDNGDEFGWDVATCKGQPLGTVQFCVLQKLAADLKSIEKSMAIISDIRNFEFLPDVWVASGYTGGAATAAQPARARPSDVSCMRIVRNGDVVSISQLPAHASVRVVDARGRLVAQRPGAAAASIDVRRLSPGAYVVSASADDGGESKRVALVR